MMKYKFVVVKRFFVSLAIIPMLAVVLCSANVKADKAETEEAKSKVSKAESLSKTMSVSELLKNHNTGVVVVAQVDVTPIFAQDIFPHYRQYLKELGDTSTLTQRDQERLFLYILEQEIVSIILLDEAKRNNCIARSEEIQSEYVRLLKNFKSEAELEQEWNMTAAKIKEGLGKGIAITRLLGKLTRSRMKKVTESEAKKLYDKIIVEMNSDKKNLSSTDRKSANEVFMDRLIYLFKRNFYERVTFSQIFIKCPQGATPAETKEAREKISAIKKELQKKQSFKDVSREYSDNPKELVVEDVIEENLSNAKAKIVFKMQVGEQTEVPLKDSDGFYFIKLEERSAKKDITFDNTKQFLLEVLENKQKGDIENSYVDELKSKRNIKRYVDLI